MSDLYKQKKHLIIYPVILIIGYVLGTSYFPPRTIGISLSSHLLVDEAIRIKSANAGLASFAPLINRLYGDSEIIGSSEWMDVNLLESLGLQVHDSHDSVRCKDGDLYLYKKDAVASLWYTPKFAKNRGLYPQTNKIYNEPELQNEEFPPVTILFLPDHQKSGQISLILCENYLIFTP